MNWAEFFDMGGRAFYVWGSFGVALVLMGAEVLLLRQRRQRALEPSADDEQEIVPTEERPVATSESIS